MVTQPLGAQQQAPQLLRRQLLQRRARALQPLALRRGLFGIERWIRQARDLAPCPLIEPRQALMPLPFFKSQIVPDCCARNS